MLVIIALSLARCDLVYQPPSDSVHHSKFINFIAAHKKLLTNFFSSHIVHRGQYNSLNFLIVTKSLFIIEPTPV